MKYLYFSGNTVELVTKVAEYLYGGYDYLFVKSSQGVAFYAEKEKLVELTELMQELI